MTLYKLLLFYYSLLRELIYSHFLYIEN